MLAISIMTVKTTLAVIMPFDLLAIGYYFAMARTRQSAIRAACHYIVYLDF